MDVYTVSPSGSGRIDRICDSEATAKAVCADLLDELGGRTITEGWADISANRDGAVLVRTYGEDVRVNGRATWAHREQRIERHTVDTTGRWFR